MRTKEREEEEEKKNHKNRNRVHLGQLYNTYIGTGQSRTRT